VDEPVGKQSKLLRKILGGKSDENIAFEDLCSLLRWLGFDERIRGSHHLFTRDDLVEILNLQPRGASAKAYQVKQVRTLIVEHGLERSDEA
jgi:hypothetical protein